MATCQVNALRVWSFRKLIVDSRKAFVRWPVEEIRSNLEDMHLYVGISNVVVTLHWEHKLLFGAGNSRNLEQIPMCYQVKLSCQCSTYFHSLHRAMGWGEAKYRM